MTSFVDKISSQLRNKLFVSGQLSESALRRSILEKIRPPEALRLSLSPLTGLCTYKLLDDLRFGSGQKVEWKQEKPAFTISDWFRRLRDSTSEHGEGGGDQREAWSESLARERLLSHQWTNMGEELVALDRATRIHRDAPEVKRIYTAVRSVAQYVTEALTRRTGLEFDLIPIGSYGTDAKIIDIDEFDFLLIHDHIISNDINDIDYNDIFTQLNDVGKRCLRNMADLPREPSIVGFYKHGPAQCTEIGWSCDHGHTHVISVDCTTAELRPDIPFSRFLTISEESIFFREIIDQIIAEGNKNVVVTRGLSDVIIDARIMNFLGNTNPYFVMAYRLLKLFNRALIPYYSEWCKNNFMGELQSPAISSHKLKQTLYRHISRDIEEDSWNVKNLPQKLATMLEEICEDADLTNFISFTGKKRHEGINNLELKHSMHKQKWRLYKICVTQLINLLREEPYSKYHHDNIQAIKLIQHKYMVFDKHSFHLLDDNVEKRCLNSLIGTTPLIQLPYPPMLFSTHPLIQWCQAKIYELYLNNPGMDMSIMDTGDLCKELVYGQIMESIPKQIDGQRLTDGLRVFATNLGVPFDLLKIKASLMTPIRARNDFSALREDRPGRIWSAWSEISDLLPHLEPQERCLIQHWCKSVFCGIAQPDINNPLYLYDCGEINGDLRRILEYLDYVMVTLSRGDKCGYTDPRVPCCVLLWITLIYCLNENMNYFHGIKSAHVNWKDAMVAIVAKRQAWTFYRQSDVQIMYKAIRMGRDGQGLLRCMAARCDGTMLDYNRSVTGLCLLGTLSSLEEHYMEDYRVQICRVYNALVHSGEQINPAHIALIESRMLQINKPWPKYSLMEVAALACILQRQFNVYINNDDQVAFESGSSERQIARETHNEGYFKIKSISSLLFTTKEPVSLLWDKSNSGNFDLLTFPDSPAKIENIFSTAPGWIISRAVSLKQFLDDSDIANETI